MECEPQLFGAAYRDKYVFLKLYVIRGNRTYDLYLENAGYLAILDATMATFKQLRNGFEHLIL